MRYASFQHRYDAVRFMEVVRERFAAFRLELHPEKTRLVEFGRFAQANRAKRGEGRPETFDFLVGTTAGRGDTGASGWDGSRCRSECAARCRP